MNSLRGTSMMPGFEVESTNLPKSNASKKQVLRAFASPTRASSSSKSRDKAT